MNQGLTGAGARDFSDFATWGTALYASTEGAGVFRVDLSGPAVWQRFGAEFAAHTAESVPSPAQREDHLIAAAGANGLVMVRDLREDFWSPVQLAGQLTSVAFTGLGLIAASRHRVFVSEDDGASWRQVASSCHRNRERGIPDRKYPARTARGL